MDSYLLSPGDWAAPALPALQRGLLGLGMGGEVLVEKGWGSSFLSFLHSRGKKGLGKPSLCQQLGHQRGKEHF